MKPKPLAIDLVAELKRTKVPVEYQYRFRSHYEIVRYIRDYETTYEGIFYLLAYELQNDKRQPILDRLYARYNRLRNQVELKSILEVA